MKLRRFLIVLTCAAIVFAGASDSWAKGKKGGKDKGKAEREARKKAKQEAFLAKKAAEGEKDWALTGTFRGTATTLQFIPDKAQKGEKQISSMSLYGKHKAKMLEMLGGGDHKKYFGKRATITFHGKPERHGTGLKFNLMKGGVMEWQEAQLLN